MKALGTMLLALSLCVGCDAGSSGGSRRSGDGSVPPTTGGKDSGSPVIDAAAAECPFIGETCEAASCPYDPEEIDCDAACTNLAAMLDCSAVAEKSVCVANCGFLEVLCANILFGCAAENNTCEDYQACQAKKFSAAGSPDAGGS